MAFRVDLRQRSPIKKKFRDRSACTYIDQSRSVEKTRFQSGKNTVVLEKNPVVVEKNLDFLEKNIDGILS